MRKEIAGQMSSNIARIERLEERQKIDKEEIRHVKEAVGDLVEKAVGERITEQSNRNVITDGHELNTILKREEADFYDVRRSIRLWPVPDGDETAEKAARDFMMNTLSIPMIEIARIAIEFVQRVSGTHRSRIGDEVLVQFSNAADRDVIKSYAPNLAKMEGKAGIRLEIPTHLRHVFRLLETHAAELRKHHPGIKWSVKFDDIERLLVLDVRVSESEGFSN